MRKRFLGAPALLSAAVTVAFLGAANLSPKPNGKDFGWPDYAYTTSPDTWGNLGPSFLPGQPYLQYSGLFVNILTAVALLAGVIIVIELWQTGLLPTGTKWYQFALGTLCTAVCLSSVLLLANVLQQNDGVLLCQGWPLTYRIQKIDCELQPEWQLRALAVNCLIAFLLLLACWIGCEWFYRRKCGKCSGSSRCEQTT